MTIRTITIEDNLESRIDGVKETIIELLEEYVTENESDIDDEVDLGNDLDYNGSVHEAIDSAVPIYTHEINNLWYLYRSEFEQAYEDSGIGDNPLENNGMVAIYCYIEQQISEWWYEEHDTLLEQAFDTCQKNRIRNEIRKKYDLHVPSNVDNLGFLEELLKVLKTTSQGGEEEE